MSENRIKCITCESMILQSTSDRNNGLCGVCKREIEHLAHNEEMGCFDEAWKLFIQSTKMTDIHRTSGKERIISIVDKFVDKNLIRQLNKPDISDEYFFLRSPDVYNQKLIGECDQDCESDAYDLMNCTELQKEWICPDVKFECKLKQIPAVPVVAAPFIIINKSVANKIADLIASSIQYFPVKIKAKKECSDEFLAVNILQSHRVWDLDISTWNGASWDESSPISMRNMMVKDSLDIKEHIFRNKDFSSLIIVSKQLGDILLDESASSISLESMNKWSN